MKPETVLQKCWGFSAFRPNQLPIIEAILSGRDTLALLPTGGGKSICFQVPALMYPGLTIVISPLLSLMKDQVDALFGKGINATYIASDLSEKELKQRLSGFSNNSYKIIYVSPERLRNKKFLESINAVSISLLVVDEAHCVSVWGHDFRPQYQNIASFVASLPKRPVVAAFTATATSHTQSDIISSLNLNKTIIQKSSFTRNISISVHLAKTATEQELELLSYLLQHKNDVGIIYVSTRHHAEKLSNKLNKFSKHLGLGRIGFYHGGMDSATKQKVQNEFLSDSLQVLVATTAFGMGIDKANISFVVHFHPSASIENYFQEIGRAGRAGQKSEAVMFLRDSDFSIQQALLSRSEGNSEIAQQKLDAFRYYCHSHTCRMKSILKYFDEDAEQCLQCDNCVNQTSPLANIVNSRMTYYKALYEWTQQTAVNSKLDPRYVLQDQQILYLLLCKCTSTTDLLPIPGIGKGWIELWGKNLARPMVQYQH